MRPVLWDRHGYLAGHFKSRARLTKILGYVPNGTLTTQPLRLIPFQSVTATVSPFAVPSMSLNHIGHDNHHHRQGINFTR